MKLFKFEHACFSLTKDEQTIVVDPGNLTSDFLPVENTVAVILTHAHPDHMDHRHLAAIQAKNPSVIIIAHPAVLADIEAFEKMPVQASDAVEVGSFSLRFFGGEHAEIHPDLAAVSNLGVLIDELIYYPGDSFVIPEVPIDTLALPVAAAWMKLSEAIAFTRTTTPRFVFPTHDGILSNAGTAIVDRMVPQLISDASTYERIDGKELTV